MDRYGFVEKLKLLFKKNLCCFTSAQRTFAFKLAPFCWSIDSCGEQSSVQSLIESSLGALKWVWKTQRVRKCRKRALSSFLTSNYVLVVAKSLMPRHSCLCLGWRLSWVAGGRSGVCVAGRSSAMDVICHSTSARWHTPSCGTLLSVGVVMEIIAVLQTNAPLLTSHQVKTSYFINGELLTDPLGWQLWGWYRRSNFSFCSACGCCSLW